MQQRDFPILQSACAIPPTAAAYSLNITVVPHGSLGYLTIWPTGLNQPVVSTLNSYEGFIVANAATVPAGTNGQVSVFVTNDTDLIIDIDGYFASPNAVSFTQITGTLSNSQLTGTYSNPVVLSNGNNTISGSFAGSFTGNGAGLTGVVSGLNWPVVPISTDYGVQISDFATPTTHGNYLILTGTLSHTFTLPNPPAPNGSCVAIGNVADAGINSGTNVFLTVSPNGVLMDTVTTSNSVVPTMPRRTSYLYCSDGTHYFRLGYQQNGVSQIGPWIKTYDTGPGPNVMTSTFRNGMDFGLIDGTMIYLLPKFTNTSNVVTLNLNGLGNVHILKYGNQGLAPGDLSTNAYANLIYNVNGNKWELINPQTLQALPGTTGSIGGSLIAAGTCAVGTASVANATVGHPVSVSASDGTLPNPLVIMSAAVTATNTVMVQLCAVANVTPVAKTFNVVVH